MIRDIEIPGSIPIAGPHTLTTLNEKIQGILPEFPGFQVDSDRLVCETNCGPITIDLYDWIGAGGDEKKILKLACEKIAWKLKQQERMMSA